MIDSSPKIMSLPIDFHEHLVQMPAPLARSHGRNTPFSYLRREHWTEAMPPVSHRFMTDIDAALVQEILDISKGQRKPHVQHHRQADDLRTGFEVAEWGAFCHLGKLRNRPARLKPILSDSTKISTSE